MYKIKKNNVEFYVDNKHLSWWQSIESKDSDWELFTFEVLDKFIKPTDVCIDLGAWIGPIALYMAKLCKKVHAIEPDVVAWNDLYSNVLLNNDSTDISIYNHAIYNYDGKLTLGNDQNLGNSTTRLNQSKNLFETDCYTLSTFCKQNNIDVVDFIKIDIEAVEEYVLQHTEFFEKYKPTLYIQTHYMWYENPDKFTHIIKNIAKLYNYIYDENWNSISYTDIGGGVLVFTDNLL